MFIESKNNKAKGYMYSKFKVPVKLQANEASSSGQSALLVEPHSTAQFEQDEARVK